MGKDPGLSSFPIPLRQLKRSVAEFMTLCRHTLVDFLPSHAKQVWVYPAKRM